MNKETYLKLLNSDKNPLYKHGKYCRKVCIKCHRKISSQARNNLCREHWKENNINSYKFKCKLCHKNITFGAKLCKKCYIKTQTIFKKGKLIDLKP